MQQGSGGGRAWRRSVGAGLSALALMSCLIGLAATTASAESDIGIEGPSYAGAYLDPSGSKPQSKLWHHDGAWFGVLFHAPSQTFRIHRLERATATWVDTGTTVDLRVNSRADVRWDGAKLHVASQRYSVTGGAGYPARYYRLSYDPVGRRFLHDSGFPTIINNVKSESLVLDLDSTGRAWATWTQSNRIYVNHTTGPAGTWATPFILPGIGTAVASDDISSVIAFGGDRIGVLWGNQQASAFYFAIHRDGDDPSIWSTETALAGAGLADDHLNIKADASGRLYAAVKTSKFGDEDPLIVLLVRDPSTGAWTSSTVAKERDSHTRPIVQLDETQRRLHVLMTGPQPPSISGQKGGDIYLKSASMDAPVFEPGLGTPILRDAGNATMNNVTGTKQSVSAATGLVALASTEATDRYWHADLDLSGTTPTSTSAPTSTSTSEPTPTTSPATSTTSPASTTTTSSTTTSTSTTSTTSTSTTSTTVPAGGVRTLPVAADAYVRSSAATTRYGASTFVRVQEGSATDAYRSYLAFDVPADLGSIRAAKLRLYVIGGSVDGGSVHLASPTWDERTVAWSTAPAFDPAVLTTIGRVADGTWVEVDVTGAVQAGTRLGLGIRNASADGAYYSSREGTNAAQLVVTSD